MLRDSSLLFEQSRYINLSHKITSKLAKLLLEQFNVVRAVKDFSSGRDVILFPEQSSSVNAVKFSIPVKLDISLSCMSRLVITEISSSVKKSSLSESK